MLFSLTKDYSKKKSNNKHLLQINQRHPQTTFLLLSRITQNHLLLPLPKRALAELKLVLK